MYQQQSVIYHRAVLTLIRILGTENIQKHELVLCALLARALLACIRGGQGPFGNFPEIHSNPGTQASLTQG